MDFTGYNNSPMDSEVDLMKCLRCGVCCTMHQAIASCEETQRIISFLKITMREWEKLNSEPRWHSDNSYLIRHSNNACIFLKRANNVSYCDINPVKPSCCTDWTPSLNKKECCNGLVKYWESTLNK